MDVHPAQECPVQIERPAGQPVRLRLADYPWLSTIVARQASASRRWNPPEGRPFAGTPEQYVAAALRGIPEFTVLFDRWLVASVSVEEVRVRRAGELALAAGTPLPADARLPYDGAVSVLLQR